jgi:hypothetical protein
VAGTFIDMVNRITSELRRSNAGEAVKNAINDAIAEAAQERFQFNEITLSFPTVVGQQDYDSLGFYEIDDAWFLQGTTRQDLEILNDEDFENLISGGPSSGQPQSIARYGTFIRIYPTPQAIYTIYVKGVNQLTPFPLVNDGDANSWLIPGAPEMYIRALAKRNFLRDVVRDYGEARVYDAIAEDYKNQLFEKATAINAGDSTIKATKF